MSCRFSGSQQYAQATLFVALECYLFVVLLGGCLNTARVAALHANGVALPRFEPGERKVLPSTANCEMRFIEQRLDHFSFASNDATFRQRYFICKPPNAPKDFEAKAIFFYCGNEANVELYVNATGLMWENADSHSAVLVFAEHRFYGESLPPTPPAVSGSGRQNRFLSHELALADYAILLSSLRRTLRPATGSAQPASAQSLLPAVAFGGSYGGKLAAWLRMKYPSAVVGSIAASAPLLSFRGEGTGVDVNDWDSGSYYAVVTRTAKFYSPHCAANIAAGIASVGKVGATVDGRRQLQRDFGLCKDPEGEYEVSMLRYFLRDAFDSLAMGNYPFASDYIAGDYRHPLPAFPFAHACSPLMMDLTSPADAPKLFPALRQAVSVLYNATRSTECFQLPVYPTPTDPGQPMDGMWDWQWCTEQLPDSYWFSTYGGARDMFWHNPYNQTLVNTHCEKAWGTLPRTIAGATPGDQAWIPAEYGGRQLLQGQSNIVFSSGSFDGWSSGGVASNVSSAGLYSFLIEGGGHHLDLMFSHPDDPPAVTHARKFEMQQIKRWLDEYAEMNAEMARATSWGDRDL